jgi:hypothetical protein
VPHETFPYFGFLRVEEVWFPKLIGCER